MDIFAAEGPGLNDRGEAFLRWFDDTWGRWSAEFSWAGELQGIVAGAAGLLLFLLVLSGSVIIMSGLWEFIKGVWELLGAWLLAIANPWGYMAQYNRVRARWAARKKPAAPPAPPRDALRRPPVPADAPKVTRVRDKNRPAAASDKAKSKGKVPDFWLARSSQAATSNTPRSAQPQRLQALQDKFGPPREGRSSGTSPWLRRLPDAATAPVTRSSEEQRLLDTIAQRLATVANAGLSAPAPIEVNEDTEQREPGQAPSTTRDQMYWELAEACVALFREHAAYSQIPHNAAEPPTGVLAVNHQDQVRGTYPFGEVVAGKPGWATALPGSPARMEAYVTDDGWEVVASCVTFADDKAKLGSWRMSSAQQGVSRVSVGPNGHEYGMTVEEAYRFLARFLQDLAHPRF